jgi:hypothetical protein
MTLKQTIIIETVGLLFTVTLLQFYLNGDPRSAEHNNFRVGFLPVT